MMCGKFNFDEIIFRFIAAFCPEFMLTNSPFEGIFPFIIVIIGSCNSPMSKLVLMRIFHICNRIEIYDLAADHNLSIDIADRSVVRVLIGNERIE